MRADNRKIVYRFPYDSRASLRFTFLIKIKLFHNYLVVRAYTFSIIYLWIIQRFL